MHRNDKLALENLNDKKFYDFLELHGHPLDGELNYDSSFFHRYKCPHGNNTAAAYKYFPGNTPGGYFRCWRCNIEYSFSSKKQNEVSQAEWRTHTERISECKHHNEIAMQRKHKQTAALAKKVFSSTSKINVTEHNYLRLKQIQNYDLRIVTTDNAFTKKAKCNLGALLIPAFDSNNELVNLERIYLDINTGKFVKRPLAGGLRIGTFFIIGKITDTQNIIYIGEGYSTMATVYEATQCPSITAFNCSNLPYVVKAIHKSYPQKKIIIVTDIDSNQAGEKYAKKAIALINAGRYLLPNFSMIPNNLMPDIKRSDFNDFFVLLLAKGLNRTAALDTVRQQIELQQQANHGIIMSENFQNTKLNQNKNEDKPKASEILLQLIDQNHFIFFHDNHQDAFSKYPSLKSGIYETRRIHDKQFKSYLSFIYRKHEGKTINEISLKEALAELEGRALHDQNSKQEKVFLRIGELNEKIYIDLCNDKWQAIEISQIGWKLLDSKDVPVYFERSQHSQSLPNPLDATIGDISKLWEIVNIPENDRILVLAYILECFRCKTAFPILVLLGLQDSGKSATQNTIRSLIDPSASNLRTAPRKVDDLVTDAGSNWLVSYNNVSSLSDEMHDDFCCIATGSGFATRKLYTNKEQIVVNIARPVVINGIFNFIRRPDLSDRAIILELSSIKEETRKTDSQLQKIIDKNLPIIFRGLLDLMVAVLHILPNVTLNKQPRMADFALLGIAVEQALEFPKNSFIDRYRANRADAKDSMLESSPAILALVEFIEQQPHASWRGRPSDLLSALTQFKAPSIHTTWPKSPHAMGGELKRYTASLHGVGIQIIDEAKVNNKKNRTGNIYQISKINHDEKSSPQYPLSPRDVVQPNNYGTSTMLHDVDINVDVAVKSVTQSVQSPHIENSSNPVVMGLSESEVDIEDFVDFKTQHRKFTNLDNDSVLI